MAGRIFSCQWTCVSAGDSVPSPGQILRAEAAFFEPANGTFKDISKLSGAAIQIHRSARTCNSDLFNDGKLEAVVENLVGSPMILRPEAVREILDQLSTGGRQK